MKLLKAIASIFLMILVLPFIPIVYLLVCFLGWIDYMNINYDDIFEFEEPIY